MREIIPIRSWLSSRRSDFGYTPIQKSSNTKFFAYNLSEQKSHVFNSMSVFIRASVSLLLLMCFVQTGSAAQANPERSESTDPTAPSESIADLTALAEDGDPAAQRRLAYRYDRGQGVAPDAKLALQWMRRSARQNFPPGQRGLGRLFERGRGVDRNYEEAVGWYRVAAEQGDIGAQINLGRMYEHGFGVKQNSEQALQWYITAARLGSAKMQYSVGAFYHTGHLVEKDIGEAIRWYKMAAEQKHATALSNLGYIYMYGEGGERDNERAFELLTHAARLGDANGQRWLARLYADGRGIARDYNRCVVWARASLDTKRSRRTRDLLKRCESEGGRLSIAVDRPVPKTISEKKPRALVKQGSQRND